MIKKGIHNESVLPGNTKLYLSPLESDVIRTLLYFDIFCFPLSSNEIYSNCSIPLDGPAELDSALSKMVRDGFIKYSEGEYYINGDKEWVERKKRGALLANNYLRKARWMSLIISQFPFVRALGISGSLSKGYADKDSDVDYFVITKKGRLWLSRTCIIAFKKLFLLGSHKWLCANYFIDENSLKIPDENPFTATEILYLKPFYNGDLFRELWKVNDWTGRFKPNYLTSNNMKDIPSSSSWMKRILEFMLGGKIGDYLDDLCFRFTYGYWKRKFHNYNQKEFEHAFRSRKNVSKHHPQNFQKKVMQELDDRSRQFERKFKVVFAK